MKKMWKSIAALLLALTTLLTVLPAYAGGQGWYVVESTSPYGYCYLYSKPSDNTGRNLGRYDNGELVYVWEYYGGQEGKWNYCYVETQDGKWGYIHDYSLTPYHQTATDYASCTAPQYVVYSTDPYGYCYLYSEPSDINGINLGRYNNYEIVKVLDYWGGQQGKWNYCKVITQKNKVGYIHDYALVPIDQMVFDYASCNAPVYYVYSTDPYGYCYLYSEPSDNTGINLGRYENYAKVKVIDYYGGQEGKWNYCLVITQKNKLGYMHDYVLKPY
ncbi:MAG: hypothetical protein E7324_04860 [Clostridiales bacterium]|nr:hypothetical protein [Clostridiales bacterium]